MTHEAPAKPLLTTREAAELLGVGTTSVKRWADAGLLACVKTPGGHRRFRRASIDAMLEPAVAERGGDAVGAWVELLASAEEPRELAAQLSRLRDDRGSWWAVASTIGRVLEEIGKRWSSGELSIMEEHLASERLSRALGQVAESLQPRPDSPTALLLVAEADEHTLGLSLLEVCLRSAGWRTHWAGRRTPFEEVRTHLASHQVEMVALSASQRSADPDALAELAEQYGALCIDHGCQLVLGGAGAWPEEPRYGHRARSFRELRRLLATI